MGKSLHSLTLSNFRWEKCLRRSAEAREKMQKSLDFLLRVLRGTILLLRERSA